MVLLLIRPGKSLLLFTFINTARSFSKNHKDRDEAILCLPYIKNTGALEKNHFVWTGKVELSKIQLKQFCFRSIWPDSSRFMHYSSPCGFFSINKTRTGQLTNIPSYSIGSSETNVIQGRLLFVIAASPLFAFTKTLFAPLAKRVSLLL